MNKHISLTIKETRQRIIAALNESGLPPCVLEGIISPIAMEITQAARAEAARAEQAMNEEESENG